MFGPAGNAVEFDGDDIIQLNNIPLAGDWSAEFVIKKTAENDSQLLIGTFASPTSDTLKLEQWRNTHQLGYSRYGVADYLFSPAAVAPLNEFIHLVYAKRVDGMSVYVNGQFAGSNTTPIPLGRSVVSISVDPLFAVLDEIVIYDRVLSQMEIAAHSASIPEPTSGSLLVASLIVTSVSSSSPPAESSASAGRTTGGRAGRCRGRG